MAHVPLPPITPRTGLWGLGFRMDLVALYFRNMSEDIADVWVIGKYLSSPFYSIGTYFYNARDRCWTADQELVRAITWVNGLVEGSTILDILERIWGEFTFLRYDPIGWVRQKIDQVSGELSYLRNDPYGWISSRLYGAFPVFYNLLGNSGWWVYNELSNRYPVIRDFITDSWSFVRQRVLDSFWWFRDIDKSPSWGIANLLDMGTGWFWDFIINPKVFIYERLKTYNYDIYLLFTDPIRWVKDKLSNLLGMSSYELDTFIPSLIRRAFGSVLSNEGGLLDYVSEAMVNLILRFI